MVFDLGIWVYVTKEETRKEKKKDQKSQMVKQALVDIN